MRRLSPAAGSTHLGDARVPPSSSCETDPCVAAPARGWSRIETIGERPTSTTRRSRGTIRPTRSSPGRQERGKARADAGIATAGGGILAGLDGDDPRAVADRPREKGPGTRQVRICDQRCLRGEVSGRSLIAARHFRMTSRPHIFSPTSSRRRRQYAVADGVPFRRDSPGSTAGRRWSDRSKQEARITSPIHSSVFFRRGDLQGSPVAALLQRDPPGGWPPHHREQPQDREGHLPRQFRCVRPAGLRDARQHRGPQQRPFHLRVAGRQARRADRGGQASTTANRGYVIDGGYFENYGALTALELARSARDGD